MRDLDLIAPSWQWAPPYSTSAGVEVDELAQSYGRRHDPEQRLALDLMYAERPDGRWSTLEFGLICQRQNLKSYVLESAAVADLFLFDNELVIWTAHLFKTTRTAFRHVKAIVDNTDHFRRRVRRVYEGKGEESIELLSGARLDFLARSKTGGRGLTGDVLIFDEAFALSPSVIGSLMPTLSSVPNPQIRYASSAGLDTSEQLRDLRDRGRAGSDDPANGDPSLTWLEWTDARAGEGCQTPECEHPKPPNNNPGCALDDVARWEANNPAVRRERISLEFIAGERRSMPPAEFARERLGWWDEPKGSAAISSALWGEGDEESEIEDLDRAEFALDVSPLQTWAAIVVAGFTVDADVHVEVTGRDDMVDHREGLEWVLPRLAELRAAGVLERVTVAGGTVAESLTPSIEKLGIEVLVLPSTQVSSACQNLYTLAAGRRLRHVGQPELDGAIGNTRWRDVGDGSRTFGRRKATGDITPAYGAALAAWQLDQLDDGRPLEDDEIYSTIR